MGNPHELHPAHLCIIFPTLLAFFSILAFELSYSTSSLGISYDPLLVWNAAFFSPDFNSSLCEVSSPTSFIRRPVSAVTGSAVLSLVGVGAIGTTAIDVSRPLRERNAYVLMEREPVWGVGFGGWLVGLGAVTFVMFASSKTAVMEFQKFVWWAVLTYFATYAWARVGADGWGRRNARVGEGERGGEQGREARVGAEEKGEAMSGSTVVMLSVGIMMDGVLFWQRFNILKGDLEPLVVAVLLYAIVLGVYAHWKLANARVRVAWPRFCLAVLMGWGSFALGYGDLKGFFCLSSTSSLQAYAAGQAFAGIALAILLYFFRGDYAQRRYTVVLQSDHRQFVPSGQVQQAYFVPNDDPYAARKSTLALPIGDGTAAISNPALVLTAAQVGVHQAPSSFRRPSSAPKPIPAAAMFQQSAKDRNSRRSIQEIDLAGSVWEASKRPFGSNSSQASKISRSSVATTTRRGTLEEATALSVTDRKPRGPSTERVLKPRPARPVSLEADSSDDDGAGTSVRRSLVPSPDRVLIPRPGNTERRATPTNLDRRPSPAPPVERRPTPTFANEERRSTPVSQAERRPTPTYTNEERRNTPVSQAERRPTPTFASEERRNTPVSQSDRRGTPTYANEERRNTPIMAAATAASVPVRPRPVSLERRTFAAPSLVAIASHDNGVETDVRTVQVIRPRVESMERPEITLARVQANSRRATVSSTIEMDTAASHIRNDSLASATGGVMRARADTGQSFTPGRTRRSSIDDTSNANPALRALQSGGRSVEQERDRAGVALDSRRVSLRSPEEALEASRRLSVSAAKDDATRVAPPAASGASLSTTERLAMLRAERTRLADEQRRLQGL